MIIRTTATDQQLTEMLTDFGYEVQTRDILVYERRHHNRDEPVIYSRLHVLVNNNWELAQPFFEKLLNDSLVDIVKRYVKKINN